MTMGNADLFVWWQANGIYSWLILLIAFLVIELMTLGLTTIWFAGGSLIAFLAGLLGTPLYLQIVIFFVSSIFLLALTRPIVKNYFNKNRVKTNAAALVGKHAVVLEEINNLKASGQVSVDGQEWSARTKNEEEIIESGTKVLILAINGVKLIVQKTDEERKGIKNSDRCLL